MIGNAMPSIIEMEPEVLKNLVKEVKETIATDIQFAKIPKRSFSIVDLWNIRRNSKPAGNRFRGY